jgi:hypothetical protein
LADGAEEAVTDSSGENSLLLSEKGNFCYREWRGLITTSLALSRRVLNVRKASSGVGDFDCVK